MGARGEINTRKGPARPVCGAGQCGQTRHYAADNVLGRNDGSQSESRRSKATEQTQNNMSVKNFRAPGTRSLARTLASGAMLGAALIVATPAQAAFHLWSVREIYSDASGTNQFIEFFTPFGGQQFLNSFGTVQVSSGPNVYTFPNDLPGDSANRAFLMGTASITNFGAPKPDFIIPNNFLSLGSGNVFFSGSGANSTYSGLPSNGSNSFTFPSTTTLINSPLNFAGQTGTIFFAAANVPPTITINSPLNGAVFGNPDTVAVSVTAADSNGGSVVNVRLLTNGVAAATNTVAPFGFTLNSLPAGSYALRARAEDNGGLSATSAAVNIQVAGGPRLIFAPGGGGPIQFQFQSAAGVNYVVERGTLTNFSPIVTNPGNGGVLQFSETNNPDSQRTYRLRLQ
jgi:hypothetical protein